MTLLEDRPAHDVREDGRPVLRTARLILRAPHPDDADAVAVLINDRRIAENTARIPHPYTRADAEAFIAGAQTRADATFYVTLHDGTLVGGCGLGRLRGNEPEIGYWYGVPYWSRGYATEGAQALIEFAFVEQGYELLHAGARVSNPASRRVLEKCGFEWIGVVLQRSLALGASVPSDRFRLTRERWHALNGATVARR
jgi:RimJ/RimL family protein N-acetyltransferase